MQDPTEAEMKASCSHPLFSRPPHSEKSVTSRDVRYCLSHIDLLQTREERMSWCWEGLFLIWEKKVKIKVFLHSIQQNKIQVKELNISELKP